MQVCESAQPLPIEDDQELTIVRCERASPGHDQPTERSNPMLGARLLQLIQSHSGPLSREVVEDLMTNQRTPAFRRLNTADVETRVAAVFYGLGKWLDDADHEAVRDEYEEMGRTRFRQGVPVSELVYALVITKSHLRRYIREHGLVDFAGDRVAPQELLPLELHSIQDFNYRVGEFFDRALYHLARGYEAAAGEAALPAETFVTT
jgi:hypothetical protein